MQQCRTYRHNQATTSTNKGSFGYPKPRRYPRLIHGWQEARASAPLHYPRDYLDTHRAQENACLWSPILAIPRGLEKNVSRLVIIFPMAVAVSGEQEPRRGTAATVHRLLTSPCHLVPPMMTSVSVHPSPTRCSALSHRQCATHARNVAGKSSHPPPRRPLPLRR